MVKELEMSGHITSTVTSNTRQMFPQILTQNILEARQIVGQWFCGWVDVGMAKQ